MAIKASNQMTLIDLTDAYSVILTNENHTFVGDIDSVSSTQTATTQIITMLGSEQVACTVGTMSTPTGLSAVSDGKTPSPTVTITATSALTSGGTFTIPVKIGDITINKVFSYAIAYRGNTGANGSSVTITNTSVTYQASASGTTTPTGTWETTIPSVTNGQYLWTKTVVSYSDGKSTTAYSVAYKGTNGSNGSSVTVSSTAITYQKGSNGTTAPTGTWSSTIPATNEGEFLWTKTVVTYSDGKSTTSYSVSRNAVNGTDGQDGADAITLVVTSSNGIIFKNTDIATTLTAHVYKAGAELTDAQITALGTIKWYKDSGTTSIATGASLTIEAGDVASRASYTAQLEGV